MTTWHIHIKGQVQGVGFRPFVFLLAEEHGLQGWVKNTVDGVHIVFNADETEAATFKNDLIVRAPVLSRPTAISLQPVRQKFFDNFQIVHSEAEGERNLLLTPDFGMCDDCRTEMRTLADRRYAYPFITCTNCGPRYSIVHALPYDRANTKMDKFRMCAACREEYDNPRDRRYFSQTNSCPACAVELALFDGDRKKDGPGQEHLIESVVSAWQAGQIVAIKGIGGYLLTCDAGSPSAVAELRKRKHRPTKPFALMYPNVAALRDFHVDRREQEMLQSHLSPIVLLALKTAATDKFANIAPALNRVGVMLPYAPLFELLLQKFGKTIVATSGNISHSPIVFEDEKALAGFGEMAELVLTNNREIVVPQDDSVVQFSVLKKKKIILRRSRGMAPTYIHAGMHWPQKCLLATGAMLKSTFSFLHGGNVYISQYLGDLEHFDTQQNYQNVIAHFLQVFRAQPELILHDKHPGYPSTLHGEHLATQWGVPLVAIQHHRAHFGAILGESNLVHSEAPVLGVIWDGTGLGDDGQVWGGEFFKYERFDFQRCGHFGYFDFILGDKMPREPRISALSACWEVEGAASFLRKKFTDQEWRIYHNLLQKKSPLQTSSVGRIFDAVASLLGILDQQTFEGEAAMRLETLAADYFATHGWDVGESYFEKTDPIGQVSTKTLFSGLVMDLQKNKTKEFLAAKFHFSLVRLVAITAQNLKIKKIAFSGGVFQNSVLVDLLIHHLESDFELFFHRELSPNDENISFGQLVCHQIEQQKKND